jgi:hypothetical protein
MTYSSQRKIQKVPAYLVKEILDEMPVFYKGYKAVLRKNIRRYYGCEWTANLFPWACVPT